MGTCDECDRDDVETSRHRIYYVDDRGPDLTELCPTCVRQLVRNAESVRSLT